MAESNKRPQYLVQAELRAARNKAKVKPSGGGRMPHQPAVQGIRSLFLRTADRSQENLRECYKRLKSPTITTYFKKYTYHEARQEAVMKGVLEIRDIPSTLYTSILSEMTAGGIGWTQDRVRSNDPT